MDIFQFIDSAVSRKMLPYVRLITVYTHDGAVTGVCLCRYNEPKIVKKAKKIGLNQDRLMTLFGKGITIKNISGHNIQQGDYYLNYNTQTKDLTIFKQ